jgi:hypothetical protein
LRAVTEITVLVACLYAAGGHEQFANLNMFGFPADVGQNALSGLSDGVGQ